MAVEGSRNSADFILKEMLADLDLGKDEKERLYCMQYFDQLTSNGLQSVVCEPERLQQERKDLREQTHQLAMDNYGTFIRAAECSKEIYKDFNVVENRLESLLSNTPLMASETETFIQSSEEVTSRRKQNSLVLAKHTHLIELLEIPQLMDTCVRNSYFEEALDLSSYVRRLEKKYSNIPVIANIASEVMAATQEMLNQLLQQLRCGIQLPACLRVISYLRQLDVFNELELRITFLQSRDVWLNSVLEEIPTKDAHQHIIKTIECHRVNLFDIITQYRAIFSDDDIMESGIGITTSNIIYSNILHAWISRKISKFLHILQSDIEMGEEGRLDSVYSTCMYFGLSFSKIGCDFRSLVIPIFYKKVLKDFSNRIKLTMKEFEDAMETYSHVNVTRRPKDDNQKWQQMISQPQSLSAAPQSLLDFSPLAHLTNGIIDAIQVLRQFPAIPLAMKINDIINTALMSSAEILSSWCSLETKSAIGDSDHLAQRSLSQAYANEFIPFINRCLEGIFHAADVNKHLGVGTNARQNARKLPRYGLEIAKLTKPLQQYLLDDTPTSAGLPSPTKQTSNIEQTDYSNE